MWRSPRLATAMEDGEASLGGQWLAGSDHASGGEDGLPHTGIGHARIRGGFQVEAHSVLLVWVVVTEMDNS